MKKLMTVLLGCLWLSLGVASGIRAEKAAPSFGKLSEALVFLQKALDNNDYAALSTACLAGEKGMLAQQRAPFDQLKSAHQAKTLKERYGKLQFPDKGDTFKLGGHDSEVGHLHVDFVRVKHQWHLQDIYLCR